MSPARPPTSVPAWKNKSGRPGSRVITLSGFSNAAVRPPADSTLWSVAEAEDSSSAGSVPAGTVTVRRVVPLAIGITPVGPGDAESVAGPALTWPAGPGLPAMSRTAKPRSTADAGTEPAPSQYTSTVSLPDPETETGYVTELTSTEAPEASAKTGSEYLTVTESTPLDDAEATAGTTVSTETLGPVKSLSVNEAGVPVIDSIDSDTDSGPCGEPGGTTYEAVKPFSAGVTGTASPFIDSAGFCTGSVALNDIDICSPATARPPEADTVNSDTVTRTMLLTDCTEPELCALPNRSETEPASETVGAARSSYSASSFSVTVPRSSETDSGTRPPTSKSDGCTVEPSRSSWNMASTVSGDITLAETSLGGESSPMASSTSACGAALPDVSSNCAPRVSRRRLADMLSSTALSVSRSTCTRTFTPSLDTVPDTWISCAPPVMRTCESCAPNVNASMVSSNSSTSVEVSVLSAAVTSPGLSSSGTVRSGSVAGALPVPETSLNAPAPSTSEGEGCPMAACLCCSVSSTVAVEPDTETWAPAREPDIDSGDGSAAGPRFSSNDIVRMPVPRSRKAEPATGGTASAVADTRTSAASEERPAPSAAAPASMRSDGVAKATARWALRLRKGERKHRSGCGRQRYAARRAGLAQVQAGGHAHLLGERDGQHPGALV